MHWYHALIIVNVLFSPVSGPGPGCQESRSGKPSVLRSWRNSQTTPGRKRGLFLASLWWGVFYKNCTYLWMHASECVRMCMCVWRYKIHGVYILTSSRLLCGSVERHILYLWVTFYCLYSRGITFVYWCKCESQNRGTYEHKLFESFYQKNINRLMLYWVIVFNYRYNCILWFKLLMNSRIHVQYIFRKMPPFSHIGGFANIECPH